MLIAAKCQCHIINQSGSVDHIYYYKLNIFDGKAILLQLVSKGFTQHHDNNLLISCSFQVDTKLVCFFHVTNGDVSEKCNIQHKRFNMHIFVSPSSPGASSVV